VYYYTCNVIFIMAIQLSRDIIHPYAKNFIEKSGGYEVFNNSEIEAINFLIKSLIDNNLWNKFKALYPFIGRTAKAHSINLINTNRHNIKWYGNVIHDRLGVTGNGGYGNTLLAAGLLKETDIHVSVYNATQWSLADNNSHLIGTTKKSQRITLKTAIDNRYTYSTADGIFFAGTEGNDISSTEAFGLIVGINSVKCYVNGIPFGVISPNDPSTFVPAPANAEQQAAMNNTVIESLDQYPILILSYDDFGSVSVKSTTNIRFASIGSGMNDQENAKFYEIVEKFQSILQRNVGSLKLNIYLFENIEKEKITANLNILSVFQKLGVFKINQIESESIKSSLSINNLRISGARRVYLNDRASSNISVISFTEI
jgi:hypothetical protein